MMDMNNPPTMACEVFKAHGLPNKRGIGPFFTGEQGDKINYMVFLKHPLWIQRKLVRQYGVPFHRIHSCSTVSDPNSDL